INATSYQTTKKSYHDIFGPWQDYEQISRKYLPDFIGTVKSFDKLKVGFSVVNGIHDSFDQDNLVYFPSSEIATLDIEFAEEKFNLLLGPSFSYLVSDKLSFGTTLYYSYDTSRTVTKRLAEGFTAEEVATLDIEERRESRGFTPVIGMQYMFTEKFVMGLTYRKNFNIGGVIRQKETLIETRPLLSTFDPRLTSVANGFLLVENRNDAVTTIVADGRLVVGTPITHKRPEINQVNVGFAFFPNQRLTISVDAMYVAAYKYYLPQIEFNTETNAASFSSPTNNYLERKATSNFSAGLEYYLTDSFILRMGYYTNNSNGKISSWEQTALELAINEQQLGGNFTLPLQENLEYIYLSNRQEYVNKFGYTIGFGYATARSSFAINVARENGSGGARLEESELPHQMFKSKTTIYFTATSRY
ncbi:MAG: hypothetical protein AAF518_01470, partial [Spirochaetota bacterium]